MTATQKRIAEARKSVAWLQWQLNGTIATTDKIEPMAQAIQDCGSLMLNLADELFHERTIEEVCCYVEN